MAPEFEEKLSKLGVNLPEAPAPAANYVPYVQVGDMLYVSGQISIGPEGLIKGKLGLDMTTEQGTDCLLYTSPSPRDRTRSRMPSSA